MSGQDDNLNFCGCCDGLEGHTPHLIQNLPAQPQIHYRIGTHQQFKASMLAGLSDTSVPALQGLSTRDDDDFTIAFLDAVATTLEVLSFYQERYANEQYLRTSVERRSILEMARLIGYELAPGVAASTHLSFLLQATPGDSTESMTIPIGTKVQSVPGQDELPQTFETVEAIEARAAWNAIPAQRTISWSPEFGDRDLYIDGVSTPIEAGDAILIVGQDRKKNAGSERWDVRVLSAIERDRDNNRTRLYWNEGLGHGNPKIYPAEDAIQVYVMRQRASLFGHNAPDPRLLSGKDSQLSTLITGTGAGTRWAGFTLPIGVIDLDAAYPKILAESWVILVSNGQRRGTSSLPGYSELYKVNQVSQMSRTDFSISAKMTRITPDTTENFEEFKLQSTLVLAQSELLPITPRPLLYPVYGEVLALDSHQEGILPGRVISISGHQQRIRIAAGVNNLKLKIEGKDQPLNEGDSLIMQAAPEKLVGGIPDVISPEQFGKQLGKSSITFQFSVIDRDGQHGTFTARGNQVELDRSHESDETISTVIQIKTSEDGVIQTRDRTTLNLSTSIPHVFRRESVRINFNVAAATHGETVSEILGDGNARSTDQTFHLKQIPLTHVSADTPSGRQSTLTLRVNNLQWTEMPNLYAQPADARVFTAHSLDEGGTKLLFGDGIEGGRLPTGQANVRAEYRKGLGVGGNLAKGKLSTLLSRPLGLSEVTNPIAATGGEDPEILDQARDNAPLTVVTLDRAVSEKDYRDFSCAYAGIAKAHALWIPAGPARGMFLTIAGIGGALVPKTSQTYNNLLNSLRQYGDPLIPLTVENYVPASFALRMSIKVSDTFDSTLVLASVDTAIRQTFSFPERDFGQHTSRDEIVAIAHTINGVDAAHVIHFYKIKSGVAPTVTSIVPAILPTISLTQAPKPAELLTLQPESLELELMA